jgi:hypothetical protein
MKKRQARPGEKPERGKGYYGNVEHEEPGFSAGWVGGPEGGWADGKAGATHGHPGPASPPKEPTEPAPTRKRR